ncbi:UDP-N-acetylglucosamine 4,6-dehydratase [Methanolobus tindarius DSM 2278]|jgi:UDP-N-acetylglucosamine 4,6-dehydratase (inverting)|uniref:UDP-N-acetylglucosamine 4,6-dehydratase n=1 Tax=Methanolobus tindarius DSM 2278 TaxID=1090322 RepID=W9DVK8_METTI|nr:UDP-N-acetylglucosamine 4,6-dehydratase (inverting) [Methanolobus tindarius]ETA67456.1 UDP-N-acetylglucosamine 4,6-dehydratase [Methanolobus tindarius DSM 2278]
MQNTIDGSLFDGKNILLTGGTGSFGKKFTEIILKEHNPSSLRIYSRGEYNQYKMQQEFNDSRLRFLIGDVRDRERLYRAMNGVDIVVHAAALKQVPACEYNPIEAIKTNIDGSVNVIDAAIDNSVERVMAISTDKAVHPVNLYGATKMVAEKLFIQGNTYTGKGRTKFSCVRYGNVIGSRGSVIPLFKEQKKEGTLTITDDRMTRFWLTLDQGVHFVLNCIQRMEGGEVFVPKIPSMKITDLAEAIAPESKKEFTGIRPGEKLHEIMITEDESRHAKEFSDYFIIEPEFSFWKKQSSNSGKSLPDNYRYSSDINDEWLTKDDFEKML